MVGATREKAGSDTSSAPDFGLRAFPCAFPTSLAPDCAPPTSDVDRNHYSSALGIHQLFPRRSSTLAPDSAAPDINIGAINIRLRPRHPHDSLRLILRAPDIRCGPKSFLRPRHPPQLFPRRSPTLRLIFAVPDIKSGSEWLSLRLLLRPRHQCLTQSIRLRPRHPHGSTILDLAPDFAAPRHQMSPEIIILRPRHPPQLLLRRSSTLRPDFAAPDINIDAINAPPPSAPTWLDDPRPCA
ncbi:hypothetical protein R3P38DRAFT_3198677 [Favolaschia claudopus]|uniref:Uncharacterized protein n=1 Tax=Favolaschia claudopus TaxID=2862362 RepID=A0AAW0B4G8_9AGAR